MPSSKSSQRGFILRRAQDSARCSSGFTLLELLLAILMMSALILALWAVYKANFGAFYSQVTRSNIKGESGRALATVGNEIRQAVSLTTAAATNLVLAYDTDGDGDDDSVQFTWAGVSGNPLNRVSGGATTPLVSSVSSLAFAYYNSSNVLLTFPVTLSEVKSVLITLASTSGDETFTVRSQVSLRNL